MGEKAACGARAECRHLIHSNLKGCGRLFQRTWFLAGVILVSIGVASASRSMPKLADYCPPEPATGQLTFKSVDSATNSACTPAGHDVIGQAVFQCWQQFLIEINECQVAMRTAEDQLVGPGRLPCGLFGVSGNLTGADGVEAVMWANVDGPGLLSYYSQDLEAVAALRYDNPRLLVRDIWAFMRRFTNDLRFDDAAWIDAWPGQQQQGGQSDQREPDSRSAKAEAEGSASQRQLVAEAEAAGGAMDAAAATEQIEAPVAKLTSGEPVGRQKHGPMSVYRSSETRVVVKVPTGCKYRYNVNPDSQVFDSPSRHHAHVEWRTIGLAVASLSVVLSVVGLGVCTHFSRRHAEYVASYWEYQAVKDQLGSELPTSMYVRLFGEKPKSAAVAVTSGSVAAAIVAVAAAKAAVSTAAAPLPLAEAAPVLGPSRVVPSAAAAAGAAGPSTVRK